MTLAEIADRIESALKDAREGLDPSRVAPAWYTSLARLAGGIRTFGHNEAKDGVSVWSQALATLPPDSEVLVTMRRD